MTKRRPNIHFNKKFLEVQEPFLKKVLARRRQPCILEVSGRDDLLVLLEKEFPEAEVKQYQDGKIEENETFDYIVASGLKYLPDDVHTDKLFRELIARLKPGGVLSVRLCGFPGYYGLVMLGTVIRTLSKGKPAAETAGIAEAVMAELPASHPAFEFKQEALEELVELSAAIHHVDNLFTVSKVLAAVSRWGGHFIQWVSPQLYTPLGEMERLNTLPEPQRSIAAEWVNASPSEHYFLVGKRDG